MHPILFRIPMPEWVPYFGKLGSVPIYSYGVMLGLSLVVGWYLTLGLADRDGLPREKMANNYVITALVAVAGSRLLYIVTNPDEFHTIGDVFSMQTGGLVVYGGFLGGFVASWAYLKRNGMRLLPWADIAVPSLASGLLITRIGCYLFGCDYGKPLSDTAPGWLKSLGTFPHWADGTLPGGAEGAPAWAEHYNRRLIGPTAEASLPVHPTQIYESLAGLALLALLLLVRRRQQFRGEVFFAGTFAYGVWRFVVELLRDDPERGALPGKFGQHVLLSVCLALFAAGFALSFARRIENEKLRLGVRIAAFVPAVAVWFWLRPGQYMGATSMSLSTSQFIALASALAVSVAYVVYHNAAIAHPDTAMDLGLPEEAPPQEEPEEEEPEEEEADQDAEDGEEEAPPEGKPSTEPSEEPSDDVDESEAEASEKPQEKPAEKPPANQPAPREPRRKKRRRKGAAR